MIAQITLICKGFVAQVVKNIYSCTQGPKFDSPSLNIACIFILFLTIIQNLKRDIGAT